MRIATVLGVCFVAVAAASCGEGEEDEGSLRDVPTSVCASGKQWASGDAESALMYPGRDCVGCHAATEGPNYVLAGTVYENPYVNEADDCAGVQGATVRIRDANGSTFEDLTNAAGNFYFRSSDVPGFTPPFTATVIVGGLERAMVTPQSTGACATCHTQAGIGGAPGRIITP